MIALIIVLSILIYISIGCCAAILSVKFHLIDTHDSEFDELITAVVFVWPILFPLGLIAFGLDEFTKFLKNMKE